MTDIVIIGGGIAGLAAAYYAQKRSPRSKITLLESGPRWGGKIITERVVINDGLFIIEGGPDAFLATKPYATSLCKELGLDGRLQGTNPATKITYVLHRNQLLPLPDGLVMMIPTNVRAILKSRLVSPFNKARMGMDFFLPSKPLNGDESLGAFISRRLGRAAYENLIEPLMSGIYAGDGDHLSLSSTFPDLRELELQYGSLVRGALKRHKNTTTGSLHGSRSAFLTPATGLSELVEALAKYLQDNLVDLRLNASVSQILKIDMHYRVELTSGSSFDSDSIILATPAPVSGDMLSSLDTELAFALHSIPYVSTATVTFVYRRGDLPRPLDGYGYIIPRRSGRRALACTWISSKFPHRAPEGYALLRVFVGRAGQDFPVKENELVELAREELTLTLGIVAEPVLTRVFIWENAMPQYNLGHPEILKRVDAALKKYPGLAVAGNGYRGIGIPDCIHSGELAVNKILENKQVNISSGSLQTAS